MHKFSEDVKDVLGEDQWSLNNNIATIQQGTTLITAKRVKYPNRYKLQPSA
jgi:hypothetical protein